jgi:hypothetical protein
MLESMVVYSIVLLCMAYSLWILAPKAGKSFLHHYWLKCLPTAWQGYFARQPDGQGTCSHCDSGCSAPKKEGLHAIKWQKK